MMRLLERILGRLPLGWLQLIHNRGRLAAALAGVAFANILIFMQLGFLGALIESIRRPYAAMDADVIVSASDMNTLADGSPLPRQRMFEALSTPGVASATPLYERGEPYRFEAKGRTLTVIGTFTIGGGFSADGYLIVSDQTFLRLFPQRASGAPNYILLRLEPGADRKAAMAQLSATLPDYDSAVHTIDEAVARDQAFQTTQRPIGIVFGFGIVIGVLVGVIIVYQVLSTDVADHIREYATFKATGYRQRFFLDVWSWGEVCRIDPEPVWLLCPRLADELVGREAPERLEPASGVVGVHEQLEVRPELVVAVVVGAPDRGVLDGAVHPLDLTLRPGVPRLGQPVLHVEIGAGRLEGVAAEGHLRRPHGPDVLGRPAVAGWIGEVSAVVGEHRVDPVGHGRDEVTKEVARNAPRRLFVQLDKGELARAVDGHEQVKPALFGVHLGHVDGEEADRVGRIAGALGLVPVRVGLACDPMALQAAVEA
jgi:putative ABC transport system permease protein